MFRRLIVILALLCLPAAAIAADVPYTGNLFESGTPVNGTRTINLAVYNVASGGSALYTQAAPLDVSNGVFHTVITVPDGVWFGGDRWIGVSVNGGGELSPRVKYYAPPHVSPVIFTAPQGGRTVTSTQWSRIDSITVTVTNPGTVIVSLLGFAQWTGSVTAAPMQLDLNTATPTDFSIYYNPPVGNANPLTMTTFKTVPAGQTKIYLWAKLTSVAQTYFVQSQHFSALYLPN